MAEEWAERHPKISFIHIYPGVVATSLGRDLPWYAKVPLDLLTPVFATKPEDCGEFMTYALTDDKFKTGYHLLSNKAEPYANPKYNTHENRELIYKHSLEVVNK